MTAGATMRTIEAFGGIPFHTCYPVVADAAHSRLQGLAIGVCGQTTLTARSITSLSVAIT